MMQDLPLPRDHHRPSSGRTAIRSCPSLRAGIIGTAAGNHHEHTTDKPRRTKRMQATARRLSVVSATSCARRRLIRDVPTLNGPEGVAFCLTFRSPEGVSRENSGDRKRCGLRPVLTAAATSMAGLLLLRAFAASREAYWATIKQVSHQDPETQRWLCMNLGSLGLGVRRTGRPNCVGTLAEGRLEAGGPSFGRSRNLEGPGYSTLA